MNEQTTQIKQERVQMDMSNDFFARRLAAIEEARARRLPAVEPEETAQTRVDQLNRVVGPGGAGADPSGERLEVQCRTANLLRIRATR
jgi:hypothetical protein